MHAKSLQSCPTLCNPMDCSLLGSSVHRILQARILKWVAMPSSRGSCQPRDQTCGSCFAGEFFTTEPPGNWLFKEHRGKLWNERRDGRQNRESWVWILIEASPAQRENSFPCVREKPNSFLLYVSRLCALFTLTPRPCSQRTFQLWHVWPPTCFSSTTSNSLQHQLDILTFNSLLTLPEVVSECQLQAQIATWVSDPLAIAWRVQ